MEVLEEAIGDLVDARGAARAAVLPRRVEHEVVHDQLAPPLDELLAPAWPTGTSRRTERGSTSSRRPSMTGCRKRPSPVHSVNATSTTRSGTTKCASRGTSPSTNGDDCTDRSASRRAHDAR